MAWTSSGPSRRFPPTRSAGEPNLRPRTRVLISLSPHTSFVIAHRLVAPPLLLRSLLAVVIVVTFVVIASCLASSLHLVSSTLSRVGCWFAVVELGLLALVVPPSLAVVAPTESACLGQSVGRRTTLTYLCNECEYWEYSGGASALIGPNCGVTAVRLGIGRKTSCTESVRPPIHWTKVSTKPMPVARACRLGLARGRSRRRSA